MAAVDLHVYSIGIIKYLVHISIVSLYNLLQKLCLKKKLIFVRDFLHHQI